ncbi:hypothetical protein ADICYQ_1521 [Cyclobacterium qasimii M12-11B]|uniref:Uncharacterized protein n=1 Tax=Cyclobacterium qasimii M12-11B TaxID=641524 RepID=S7WRQ4_9BACT|nr:hypothetical protein ADICYQ_1521 [Cyclobacterium qasimii M12-11B]
MVKSHDNQADSLVIMWFYQSPEECSGQALIKVQDGLFRILSYNLD